MAAVTAFVPAAGLCAQGASALDTARGAVSAPLRGAARGQHRPRSVLFMKADAQPKKGRAPKSNKAKPSKKDSAPYKVATDLKGIPVWTMRLATVDDLPFFQNRSSYPDSLLRSFLEADEKCCVVAEIQETRAGVQAAAVDPTKRGGAESNEPAAASSGSSMKTVAGVLVSLQGEVVIANDGEPRVQETGEVLLAVADPRMPEAESVRQRVALAALRQMKTRGVVSVTQDLPRTSGAVDFYKELGLVENVPESSSERVILQGNLIAMSPDPQKKLS